MFGRCLFNECIASVFCKGLTVFSKEKLFNFINDENILFYTTDSQLNIVEEIQKNSAMVKFKIMSMLRLLRYRGKEKVFKKAK